MGQQGAQDLRDVPPWVWKVFYRKKKKGTLLNTGTGVPSLFFCLLDYALPPYREGTSED